MRTVTQQTTDAWLSGDFVGDTAPMQRATIQELHVLTRPAPDRQAFRTAMFGQHARPVELPNIKSIHWERTIDADAGRCTITLYNTEPLPLGEVPERESELGIPGAYTFNRGKTEWSQTRWGFEPNGWVDRLVPDRIIRTFEGYGYDPDLPPELDPNLYPSGVWRIDDVDTTTDGLITVECRDLGSLLIDQIMFPPIVPFAHYPLKFDRNVEVPDPLVPDVGSTTWRRPSYDTDSNVPYVGVNGNVYGHHGTDAFDTSDATYWLSVGNATPNSGYSFEFIQGRFPTGRLSAVKFHAWGGPYRIYVSVKTAAGWRGRQIVPYDPNNPASAPNGADIPFLYTFTCSRDQWVTYTLPVAVDNAIAVRLTFTSLFNSGVGTYHYRAGVRDFQIALGVLTMVNPGTTHTVGDYGDYTELVKLLLAYGGFWWPRKATDAAVTLSDGTVSTVAAPSNDPFLHLGRVWGDFEDTGTSGPSTLGVDIWDKKPLADGVNYIKDIVGFIFFIDETGGAVFRSPNIWQVGNYVGDGGPNTGRTSQIVEIDERTTLIGLTVKLSGRNQREKVFIANTTGKIGAVANGHIQYPAGIVRVAGWTDTHFSTKAECQIMADLITLRQLFTYRTDSVTIPGYPRIQIDDQVRVWERITNEGYLHYVKGISSDWDLETKRWTYRLDTHWLGEEPFGKWVFDPANLAPETQAYLATLGKV